MSGTQINLDQLGTVFVQGDRTRHVMVEEASFFALVDAVKAAQAAVGAMYPSLDRRALIAALEPFSSTEKTQQTTTVETAEPSVTEEGQQ